MAITINLLFDENFVRMSVDAGEIRSICLPKQVIESMANIYNICISKEYIVLTRDVGAIDADRKIGNIDAYNWDGDHLWNIADIDETLTCATYNGQIFSRKSHGLTSNIYIDGRTYFRFDNGCNVYVLDLEEEKIIDIMQTR